MLTVYSFQVFRALQTAYIQLLQNPFYSPDDHTPSPMTLSPSVQITNQKFIADVKKIGESWNSGVAVFV